ncbi:MAG: hypothetical protein CL666_14290 [Balneola sp.]|nr:hypothetical protein [Balneola sp.]|tara:strand:- start:15626 stop:19684 length:4059 start_codon:yes stop_codon:yes gene_type:complete
MIIKLTSKWMKQAFITTLVILMPMLLQARQIDLSVSDSSAIAGTEILIPVNTSLIALSDEVNSGNFEFSLNENIFELTGFEKQGTLLEEFDVFFNSATNRLAFAGSDTVSGSGPLIYLKLKAKDDAAFFNYTDLTFQVASINEGNVQVSAEGARFRIRGITIQPRSGIEVLEGNDLQFSLSGDIVEPVSWSVTDTSVAQINNAGLLTAKVAGLIQVKAQDGQGLRDSTVFFRVQPSTLQDLSLTISDISERQTKSFELPISVSDVTGLQVLSAGMTVNFDTNDLELLGVTNQGTLTESWGEPNVNTSGGTISIAAAGTDTLEGAGSLFLLNFRVKQDATGSSNITLSGVSLNEGLDAEITNGRFSALSAPDIFISQGDTAVSIGDDLQFSVTNNEGTAPYTWQVSDPSIATIDSNTGTFSATGRGEVVVSALDADDFPSEEAIITINDFDAWLNTVQVEYPDTAELEILTEDLSSYNLISYVAEFSYDTTKMEFLGIETDQTLSENLSVQTETDADNVLIAAASTSSISGTGAIVKLRFKLTDEVVNGESIPVDLIRLEFDEPAPSVPTITPLTGFVEVIRAEPPEAPELSSPVNNTSGLDITAEFSWEAALNAEEYRFQLSEDLSFGTVLKDSSYPDISATISGLEYGTTYYWRVRSENTSGASAWTSPNSFTTISAEALIPGLLMPENGAQDQDTSLTLSWSEIELATTYHYQLSKQVDFTPVGTANSMVAATSVQVNDLDYGTEYFWRVRSVTESDTSDWSDAAQFQTKIAKPGISELVSPNNSATEVEISPVLTWNYAARADSFIVQLASSNNFNTTVFEDVTKDTSTVALGLDYETNYYWRVKAKNSTGESNWGQIFSFTTKAADAITPELLSPANEAADMDTALVLSWEELAVVESYQLQVSENVNFSSLEIDLSGISENNTEATGLDFGSAYYWRVRSFTSQDTSDWSGIFEFTTKIIAPKAPQIVSPVNAAVDIDISPELIWRQMVNAESYLVEVSEAENFGSTVFSENVADTVISVSSELNYESVYYWRVSAVNEAGESEWSEAGSFTTIEKVNEAPVVSQKLGSLSLLEDFGENTAAILSTNFSDPEGEELTFEVINNSESPFEVTLQADSLMLRSNRDENGVGSIIVKATDPAGLWVSDTLNVEIIPVNDLPSIEGIPDTLRFKNDESLIFRLDTSITDIEDLLTDLEVLVSVQPNDILLDINEEDLSVTISAPDFVGEGTITVTVTDLDEGSIQASITVIVETAVSNELDEMPLEFRLEQNYPNPFNPSTNISFSIPKASMVRMSVYDMLGRNISTLVNERKAAGRYTIRFEAGNLSSGTYIYRIEAGSFTQTKKLMLIK